MGKPAFEKGDKWERVERKLKNPEPALKQIGILGVEASQHAFVDQKYGGVVWKPRAVPSVFGILKDFAEGADEPKARRFDARPALRDTDQLLGSIAFHVLETKTVEIGTKLPYAAIHNFGSDKLGVKSKSEKITKDVRRRLWIWLKEQPKELKRKLGWLLNRKFIDKELEGNVPERPFIGLTDELKEDIESVIGTTIVEVN